MKSVLVHQLVHGYRKGHNLLAASVHLQLADADLVARLSDLSGSLATDRPMLPYLTLYPLHEAGFFAVARTWIDEAASRSGCVVTHTILVPNDTWKYIDPRLVVDWLTLPTSDTLGTFERPIEIQYGAPRLGDNVVDSPGGIEFVRRFFGEGIRPIVWFGEEEPDRVALACITMLWPSLRSRFSCCTMSLQPRLLHSGPFDVMFAPATSYAGFTHFSPEQMLDASHLPSDSSPEPWCQRWAAVMFGGERVGDTHVADLLASLPDEPTAIRALFLAQELRQRIPSSPAAAAGAMDILERIAADPGQAVDFKKCILEDVRASLTHCSDSAEVVQSIALMLQRLRHPAFQQLGSDTIAGFVGSLSDHAQRAPSLVLALVDAQPEILAEVAVRDSLAAGCAALAQNDPKALRVLSEHSELASLIIAREPSVASGFIKGVRGDVDEPLHLRRLIDWVRHIDDPDVLLTLRLAVLPQVRRDHDIPLFLELVRGMTDAGVPAALDALFAEGGEMEPELLRAVEGYFVTRFAVPVLGWSARVAKGLGPTAAHLVAGSYSLDPGGVMLIREHAQSGRWASLQPLLFYLRRLLIPAPPGWIETDSSVSECLRLVLLDEHMPLHAKDEICDALTRINDLDLGCDMEWLDAMESIPSPHLRSPLVRLFMRSVIRGTIMARKGVIPWSRVASKSWAGQWLDDAAPWDLRSIVHNSIVGAEDNVANAWVWFAELPEGLYRRKHVLCEVADELMANMQRACPEEVSASWSRVLRRALNATDRQTYLVLCAKALKYCLNHLHDPVSEVIVAAFFDVHQAVIEDRFLSREIESMFGLFDWDKSKELRKRLIRCFMSSDWPPGDLVLAARQKWLLRKVFRRTRRLDGGCNYLQLALNDLQKRPGTTEELALALAEMIANPNFSEAWD